MKLASINSKKIINGFSFLSLLFVNYLFFGCEDNRIQSIVVFDISEKKSIKDDKSLYCQVMDTIVEDTLFVEIKVTNKSEKSVYLPLNNWYFDGWPKRQLVERSYYLFESFPDFNITYNCNILLFCEDNEWKNPSSNFFLPAPLTYPIIKKINPGQSFYYKISILNFQFMTDSVHKLKIKGNILYALSDAHIKLIRTLNIDEKQVLRDYDTLELSCNMNHRPWSQEELYRGFLSYTDSTKIDKWAIYPEIERNTYRENLLLLRKLFLQYYKIGYSFIKDDLEFFNKEIEEYNAEPQKFTEPGDGLSNMGYLFLSLIEETYCYSVKFKNY
jgi:hypothetical protein